MKSCASQKLKKFSDFWQFCKNFQRCLPRSKFGNGFESVVNHRGWVPKEGPENEDQPLSDSDYKILIVVENFSTVERLTLEVWKETSWAHRCPRCLQREPSPLPTRGEDWGEGFWKHSVKTNPHPPLSLGKGEAKSSQGEYSIRILG